MDSTQSAKDIEIAQESTLNFAKKMMQFFQKLRDDCHDFIRQNEKVINQSGFKPEFFPKEGQHSPVKHSIQVPQKSNKKESRNKEKDKDKDKVKKPMSAFLMYYSENYHRIAKKYPGNPFKEMMKYVSQEWRELSKDEQEPYIKKFEESRQLYQSTHPHDPQSSSKKKVKLNQPSIERDPYEDLKSIGSLDSLSDESLIIQGKELE